jgi:hypothetical protein
MADTAFFIMFGSAVVYVVLGNYLYFSKILPALDQSPKLLPNGQLGQVDQYLTMLNERDERQWFEPLLRNARSINAIFIIGFAITVALVFIES